MKNRHQDPRRDRRSSSAWTRTNESDRTSHCELLVAGAASAADVAFAADSQTFRSRRLPGPLLLHLRPLPRRRLLLLLLRLRTPLSLGSAYPCVASSAVLSVRPSSPRMSPSRLSVSRTRGFSLNLYLLCLFSIALLSFLLSFLFFPSFFSP